MLVINEIDPNRYFIGLHNNPSMKIPNREF